MLDYGRCYILNWMEGDQKGGHHSQRKRWVQDILISSKLYSCFFTFTSSTWGGHQTKLSNSICINGVLLPLDLRERLRDVISNQLCCWWLNLLQDDFSVWFLIVPLDVAGAPFTTNGAI